MWTTSHESLSTKLHLTLLAIVARMQGKHGRPSNGTNKNCTMCRVPPGVEYMTLIIISTTEDRVQSPSWCRVHDLNSNLNHRGQSMWSPSWCRVHNPYRQSMCSPSWYRVHALIESSTTEDRVCGVLPGAEYMTLIVSSTTEDSVCGVPMCRVS